MPMEMEDRSIHIIELDHRSIHIIELDPSCHVQQLASIDRDKDKTIQLLHLASNAHSLEKL